MEQTTTLPNYNTYTSNKSLIKYLIYVNINVKISRTHRQTDMYIHVHIYMYISDYKFKFTFVSKNFSSFNLMNEDVCHTILGFLPIYLVMLSYLLCLCLFCICQWTKYCFRWCSIIIMLYHLFPRKIYLTSMILHHLFPLKIYFLRLRYCRDVLFFIFRTGNVMW